MKTAVFLVLLAGILAGGAIAASEVVLTTSVSIGTEYDLYRWDVSDPVRAVFFQVPDYLHVVSYDCSGGYRLNMSCYDSDWVGSVRVPDRGSKWLYYVGRGASGPVWFTLKTDKQFRPGLTQSAISLNQTVYQTAVAPVAVPEPSGGCLIVFALVFLVGFLRLRHRA